MFARILARNTTVGASRIVEERVGSGHLYNGQALQSFLPHRSLELTAETATAS